MAYVIVKRSDIPEKVLQVLDLKPNSSRRNLVYDPDGRTKYLRPFSRNTIKLSTSGGITKVASRTVGLEGYLAANCGNGTPIQAEGTVTVTTPAITQAEGTITVTTPEITQAEGTITVTTPAAGATITIGGVVLTAVAGARTPGSDDFDQSSGDPATIAADIVAAINDAGNSFATIATATSLAGVVTLEAVPAGVLGNAVTLASNSAVTMDVSGATLEGGYTATITIGGVALTAVAGARTPGSDDFDQSSGIPATIAASIAAAINDAGNSFATIATATSLDGVVTLEAVPVGTLGNAVTLASNSAVTMAVSGATLEGGSNESALSVSQITADVTAILGLLGWGSLTAAAVDMDRASVNSALATATLSVSQWEDVMDILSGREYVVPAGSVVDDNGVFGVPSEAGFTTGTFKELYDTDVILSANTGVLSKYMDTAFTYKDVGGTHGEAVVVYRSDGTLY